MNCKNGMEKPGQPRPGVVKKSKLTYPTKSKTTSNRGSKKGGY